MQFLRLNSKYNIKKKSICHFFGDLMSLYRYGSWKETILMILGTLCIIAESAYPFSVFKWGKQLYHFIIVNIRLKETLDQSLYISLSLSSILVGTLISMDFFAVWRLLSETVSRKIRVKFLEAFTKKSIAWIQFHIDMLMANTNSIAKII